MCLPVCVCVSHSCQSGEATVHLQEGITEEHEFIRVESHSNAFGTKCQVWTNNAARLSSIERQMLKLPQDEIKVIVHTKNKSALLFTFTLSLSFTLRSFLFPQHTLAARNAGALLCGSVKHHELWKVWIKILKSVSAHLLQAPCLHITTCNLTPCGKGTYLHKMMKEFLIRSS